MRAGLTLAVVVLALAAGCGGSSTKGSETATTQAAPRTIVPSQPSFTSKNCAQLLRLGETFANALQASTSADTALADAAKAFGKMADAAPSEIRGEFQTLAGAFDDYAQAIKDAGITLGATPTPAQIAKLGDAAKGFGKPEVQAAQKKISAWAAANCGVKTTTG